MYHSRPTNLFDKFKLIIHFKTFVRVDVSFSSSLSVPDQGLDLFDGHISALYQCKHNIGHSVHVYAGMSIADVLITI